MAWATWTRTVPALVRRQRLGGYLLTLLVLAPLLAHPSLEREAQAQDVLVVLDVSDSMEVADGGYPQTSSTRLEVAREAAMRALASLDCGSRVAVGLFAGEEVVPLFEPVEVCGHYPVIAEVLSGLTTRMRWIGDSRVEAGLVNALREASQRQLGLLFITDGDEMPHRQSPRLIDLRALRGKVRGAVLWVGGEVPLPVPRFGEHGEPAGYWTALDAVREGNYPNLKGYLQDGAGELPPGAFDQVTEYLSAARPDYLGELAGAAGLELRHLAAPDDAVASVRGGVLSRSTRAPRDARPLFAIGGSLLLIHAWSGVALRRALRRAWPTRAAGAPGRIPGSRREARQ